MYLAEHLSDEDAERDCDVDATLPMLSNLSGLIISQQTVLRIVESILSGDISDIDSLKEAINSTTLNRKAIEKAFALKTANDIYGWMSLDSYDRHDLIASCRKARGEWLALIRKDAEREYSLGDVEREQLDAFLNRLA